jgi:hypothetical protein
LKDNLNIKLESQQVTFDIYEKMNTDFIEVNWIELKSKETYDKYRRGNSGFIVITDVQNPNRIHLTSCSSIKDENFEKKVLISKNKNGRYFWTDNLDFAVNKWKTHLCLKCIC